MALDLDRFPTSPTALKMMGRVSPIYDKSYVGKWLFQVMGLEWDQVWAVMDSLWEQPFLEQATWSLRYWEQMYGLETDETKSYEERRRLIAARRNAHFPMNPARFENLIAGLTGGTASLTENTAAYTSTLTVTDPDPGMSAAGATVVLQTIRRVKPSHHHIGLRSVVNPEETPLRVGAAGSIVTQLIPHIQPDNLQGTQTIYTGGQPAAVIVKPAAHQPDNLRGGQTVRFGGQPAAVVLKPAPHEPDRPPRPQTIRTGGTGAVLISTVPGTQPDTPPSPQTIRTGGTGAVLTSTVPGIQPDTPPRPQNTRTGGTGTRVTVRRGTVIDGRIT